MIPRLLKMKALMTLIILEISPADARYWIFYCPTDKFRSIQFEAVWGNLFRLRGPAASGGCYLQPMACNLSSKNPNTASNLDAV